MIEIIYVYIYIYLIWPVDKYVVTNWNTSETKNKIAKIFIR